MTATIASRADSLSADLRTELLDLGTATLYEASGLDCILNPALRPVWRGARICAPILPVLAASGDNLPLHRAVEAAQPGDVLLVDAGGAVFGYWGEVLTVAAQARDIAGLVIDGGVRDTDRLEALAFPVFSSSVALRGTVKRVPGLVGEPLTLGPVTVRRGDILVADADGVIALPQDQVQRILEASRQRAAKEAAWMQRLRQGELTLDILNLR